MSVSSLINGVTMTLKLEELDTGGDLGLGILKFTSHLGEVGVSTAQA